MEFNQITVEEKNSTIEALRHHLEATNQTGTAFAKRHGSEYSISGANISHILSGRWPEKTISDNVWRSIQQVIGYTPGWTYLKTRNWGIVETTLRDAKATGLMLGLVGETGRGKTSVAKKVINTLPNTYYLNVEFLTMRKAQIIRAAARAVGLVPEGSASKLLQAIRTKIHAQPKPLFVLDEVDKGDKEVFLTIKTMFDNLGCGMVIMGVPGLYLDLHKKAMDGLKGYEEFMGRVQGWSVLDKPTLAEKMQVAKHNCPGLDEAAQRLLVEHCTHFRELENSIIALREQARRVEGPITLEMIQAMRKRPADMVKQLINLAR